MTRSEARLIHAKGLDLSDPEDRAIFRTRVADWYKLMRLSYVREEAQELTGKRPETRGEAIRAVADYFIGVLQEEAR